MTTQKELKYQFYIGASPEKVWEVLVSPEGVKQVYAGCIIQSTFEVGDSLFYVGPGADGDETVHVYGKVLQFEPNKVFSFTHHVGKSYYDGEQEFESRITYQLEAVGECTKLTLVHDQWLEGDPFYVNSEKAWWMLLSNTKTVAETGQSLVLG